MRRVECRRVLLGATLFLTALGCTGTANSLDAPNGSDAGCDPSSDAGAATGAAQAGGGAGSSDAGQAGGGADSSEAAGGGAAGGGADAGEVSETRGGLFVHEGFSAAAAADLNGFSNTSSVGLVGRWMVARGSASVEARPATTGWDGARANTNHALPLDPSGSFNFVENNSSLMQATRGLATPVDLTTSPHYLSFLTSSGTNDFIGQAGLRNSSSGKELMFGQGWSSGSGVHSDTSASVDANTGCRGQNPSPALGNWEVTLWIAKVQKTGAAVVTTMYAFNLNTLSSPLPWNENGAIPLWSQTLDGVTDDRFDELEVEVAGYAGNYPSIGQIRLGGTWGSVTAMTVSSAERVWTGGGADDNWSTGENWDKGASPTLGERVRFAGEARTATKVNQRFALSSLSFDPTAGSFTIAGADGDLSLAEGITNNSTNAQTLAVPVVLEGPQTIKAASGDVTLTGRVSGSGGLTVAGGGTVTLASLYPGNTAVSGRLVLATPGDATYSGALSGDGALVKAGVGGLTLSGSNHFSGTTTVSSGALTLASPRTQKAGAHIRVADGAKLGVTANADATSATTDSLTVGVISGATLEFAVAGTTKVLLDSKVTTLNGTTTINITRTPRVANADFPLFSGYTGGALVLGSEPRGWHGTLTVTGSIVNYRVTSIDFVHPGVLSTRQDLLRMREKVKAGEEPWKSAYAALVGNRHSQSGYVAYPHPTPCRGGCVGATATRRIT